MDFCKQIFMVVSGAEVVRKWCGSGVEVALDEEQLKNVLKPPILAHLLSVVLLVASVVPVQFSSSSATIFAVLYFNLLICC